MNGALPLARCRLGPDALDEQLQRYRQLAAGVQSIERDGGRLLVEFAHDFDRALLEEATAIERRCCAFFRLDYAPEARHLTVRVDHPQQEPALDALELALSPR